MVTANDLEYVKRVQERIEKEEQPLISHLLNAQKGMKHILETKLLFDPSEEIITALNEARKELRWAEKSAEYVYHKLVELRNGEKTSFGQMRFSKDLLPEESHEIFLFTQMHDKLMDMKDFMERQRSSAKNNKETPIDAHVEGAISLYNREIGSMIDNLKKILLREHQMDEILEDTQLSDAYADLAKHAEALQQLVRAGRVRGSGISIQEKKDIVAKIKTMRALVKAA